MTVALDRATIPASVQRLLVREVASSSPAHRRRFPRSQEDGFMVHHRRGVLFVGIAVLTLSIVGAGTASAQDAVLRGKIISDRGEPVSGANVVVEELRMSASTNATGEYSLVVPGARVRGQQVVVRARGIGFKPNSKAITLTPGEQTVDLTLPYDVNLLEAVVVTGVQEATEQVKVPFIFFFKDTATTEIYTLSLHDALPI